MTTEVKVKERADALELLVLARPNFMEQERWEQMIRGILADAEKLPSGWEYKIATDTNLLLKGNPLQDGGFIPEAAVADDALYCALNRLWKHLAWFRRKNSCRSGKLELARAA